MPIDIQFTTPRPYHEVPPTREVAEAAAAWWAERIFSFPHRDNGSDREPNHPMNTPFGVAALLSASMAEPMPDEANVKAFTAELANLIVSDHRTRRNLTVDYAPSADLDRLARKHSIEPGRFPWKTVMRVYETYATARLGYGGEEKCVAGVMPWQANDNGPGPAIWYCSATTANGREWAIRASSARGNRHVLVSGEEQSKAVYDLVLRATREGYDHRGRSETYDDYDNRMVERFEAQLAILNT